MDFLKDVNIKDVLFLMFKFIKLLFIIDICFYLMVWWNMFEFIFFFFILDMENDVNVMIFCGFIIFVVDKERE